MAKVQLCNVDVLKNPSPFFSPLQFEITFECIEELQEDLEWKMIYVGSAESEENDQILDTIYVGPVPEGRHKFVFEVDPPDPTKIPVADAIGVTVILLVCCYKSQEFVRVGYFINNEYDDPELKENPPMIPEFNKVIRNILDTSPRVTRFKINWDDSNVNSETVENFNVDINRENDENCNPNVNLDVVDADCFNSGLSREGTESFSENSSTFDVDVPSAN